ncbi:MAG: hypothetical protein Q4F66_14605, partial [Clostridium sp.]|nr:hypothetical protein [Clostridium sp.]
INYSRFSIPDYHKKIRHYKRLFRAFPRLMRLNIEVKNREIKEILNEKLDKVKIRIENEIRNR